jgi:hypothetical protein
MTQCTETVEDGGCQTESVKRQGLTDLNCNIDVYLSTSTIFYKVTAITWHDLLERTNQEDVEGRSLTLSAY